MRRAGIALRAEAGTLRSAGRATFLGCTGGLLSAVGTLKLGRCAVLGAHRCATSARNDERARTRNLGSTIFFKYNTVVFYWFSTAVSLDLPSFS